MRGEEPKAGGVRLGATEERSDEIGLEAASTARTLDGQPGESGAYVVEVDSASVPPRPDPGNDLTEIQDPSQSGPKGPVRARRDPPRPGSRSGQLISGRYRIEREVAKGGMGRVYLATQLPLGRPVAIKVLNPDFQKTDPQFVRRFCLEASISSRLTHPNVITIHDYGEAENGDLYMAMEYLDGEPLSRLIAREAPLAADRLLHIAIQICRALREAHDKGVIHRDLKPGNVMIVTSGEDPDFVKVLDFGLVKLFQKEGAKGESDFARLDADPEQEGDLTRAGTLLGSPRYMSPEQIRGDALDPRTDIYSLGIIMYQMATGRPPFSGKTSVDVIYKHMNHAVPPIEAEDCPPPLEHVILRCLEKDRAKRYDSMPDLLRALKDAQRLITGNSAGTDSIPISGAHARAWSGVAKPVVSDVPREAAFRDRDLPDEPTPSGSLHGPPRARTSGRKLPVLLLALTAVTAAAVTALLKPDPEPPPPAPPPIVTAPVEVPAGPVDAVVRLSSTPGDAVVLEGEDVLGKTPLEIRLPISEVERRFTFRKAGYTDLTIIRTVGAGEVNVQAELEAAVAPPAAEPPSVRKKPVKKRRPEAEAADEDEDEEDPKKRPSYYRDNPY